MLSSNEIDKVRSSVMPLDATRPSESRVLIHPRGFGCCRLVKVSRSGL